LKINFITWTGDNSAHNVWNNTNEEVYQYTSAITKDLNDALGKMPIQVYPSLGNHDVWPVNVEDFSASDSNYQINHLKSDWADPHWMTKDEVE